MTPRCRIIPNVRRSRYPYREPDYCYHYRRYLGRDLTPAERAVIYPMERQRCHHRPIRAVIADPYAHCDPRIRLILISYFRWLVTRILPNGLDTLVMSDTKASARAASRHIPEVTVGTHRRPDHIRGCHYHYALLLDCRSDYNKRLRQAINGSVPDFPATVLIVHSRYPLRSHSPAYLFVDTDDPPPFRVPSSDTLTTLGHINAPPVTTLLMPSTQFLQPLRTLDYAIFTALPS